MGPEHYIYMRFEVFYVQFLSQEPWPARLPVMPLNKQLSPARILTLSFLVETIQLQIVDEGNVPTFQKLGGVST